MAQDAMADARLQAPDAGHVPFYLYPLDGVSMWAMCKHSTGSPKHDHADFAIEQMLRHPWRRSDPTDPTIRLAVLPVPIDHISRGQCRLNGSFAAYAEKVARSVCSHGNGGSLNLRRVRHLIIANDFMSRNAALTLLRRMGPQTVWAGMEGPSASCRFGLGYTSNYATYMSLRNPGHTAMPMADRPASSRIYSVHMVGQFDRRSAYKDRLKLFLSKGSIPNAYIAAEEHNANHNASIGGLRRCMNDEDRNRCVVQDGRLGRIQSTRTQEQSNYTLALRGDSLGSDRWINAMAAGTALMTVVSHPSDLNWLPFQTVIPWHSLVITIQRATYERDPAEAIRAAMARTSPQRLQHLQNLSRYYVADLDWEAYHSRALTNMLREALATPCSPTAGCS